MNKTKQKLSNQRNKTESNALITIKNWFFNNWCLIFAFLIPIILLAICWAFLFKIYDNKLSTLILDMNAQYVYFFEQLQDVLRGEASIFYTFERAMGGEFLGCFSYYLASPLSLLVALFPKGMVPEAIATLMLLKAGLSGLTFCIYLRKTHVRNPIGFSMFSVMYALCAYAVAYQSNIMWIDALIWLPLITLGIEAMIKEGKFKLYIVSLAIAIWSNYYIGYMLCAFTLLYFVFYMLTHSKEVRNPNGISKHTLKSIGRYVAFTAIAIMIAGAMILSAVYSLKFGKTDKAFDFKTLIPTVYSGFLDVFANLFIGTFGTFRPVADGGMPHLYAGTLMILMLPIFYASKKISTRLKIGYSVLCAVFIASMTITTFNLAWHGFNEPVWLSYRFSFIFTFIMLLMAYKGYECLEETKFKFLAIFSGATVGLLFIIQKTVEFKRKETEVFDIGLQTVWLTIILLIGYLVIFYFLKSKPTKVRLLSSILCGVVCFEALVGATLCWKDAYLDAGSGTYENYNTFEENSSYIIDYFENHDDALYRVERTFNRKSNDNLYLNLYGVSEFTSTFNRGSKAVLKKFGIQTKDQSSLYYYRNELADSLLGIKYLISDEEVNKDAREDLEKTSCYVMVEQLENDYRIYRNPYALPFAYSVKDSVEDLSDIVIYSNELTTKKSENEDKYWDEYAQVYSLKFADCLLGTNYFKTDKVITQENLVEITSELKKNSLRVSEHSDTYIKGTITAVEEKPVVFTTIPYDENWQVYIDGHKTETYKCANAFIGFDIDEGNHTVEFKYVPMQFYKGLAITLVGISAFIVLCVWDSVNKKRIKTEEYKKL